MQIDCSLIIVHYNRETHLKNVLNKIAYNANIPAEVILINFGDQVKLGPYLNFKLRQYNLPLNQGKLNVALGRNVGAKHAVYDDLLFLDVDCMPAANYLNNMIAYKNISGGLLMGSPRYLREKVNTLKDENLNYYSELHPNRPIVEGVKKEEDYFLFWSLCFGISKTLFKEIGGFDVNYSGYGGEDTDFAQKAKKNNIPFYLCDANVFHQQHIIYKPPLHQLEAIVNNCNLYFSKWGEWIMKEQLFDFKKGGFISWDESTDNAIEIVTMPCKKEINSCLRTNLSYA